VQCKVCDSHHTCASPLTTTPRLLELEGLSTFEAGERSSGFVLENIL
jgi:hypothetical protein